MTMMSYDIIID